MHKTNIIFSSAIAVLSSALVLPFVTSLMQTEKTSAANTANLTLNANVIETLTVSLTTPETWAAGGLNPSTYTSDFLRNKVNVEVLTNAGSSYSVSMYAIGGTTLVNNTESASTISTLSSNTTASAFPTNKWGYSITDSVAGSSSATYLPVTTTAAKIFDSNSGVNNKDVFFGAKADASTNSGTYSRTVAFSAVTGVTTPEIPTNPATPETPANQNDSVATYTPGTSQNPVGGSATGVTTYTTNNNASPSGTATGNPATEGVSGQTVTNTTQVTKGDTRASYSNPAGVTTTNVSEGTPLATTLAAAAVVSAAAGTGFYLLAKKQERDSEDE